MSGWEANVKWVPNLLKNILLHENDYLFFFCTYYKAFKATLNLF